MSAELLNFQYKGIAEGKYVEGDIEALNDAEAAHKLKDQKIIITKLIKAKKKKLAKIDGKTQKRKSLFGNKVKADHILVFCKQFATMQRAGLPVLETLKLLEGQTTAPGMKEVINKITTDLETGNALSKCFERHPKVFDPVIINLIKAGEASGKLDIFMEKIVTNLEKKEKIKRQIKSAFFYPGVLLTVALSVSVFMLTNVVPTFVEMYENMGMGDKLPNATKIVMGMSAYLRSAKGLITGILVIIFIFAFKFTMKKSYLFRKLIHKNLFKMPVFGNLLQKSILAKVSIVLGNLNQAGVDLIESLDIAKEVTTNVIVVEALENIKKGIFSGDSLTVCFKRETVFPPTFTQLISVGEQTGSLDEMFNSVALYYEEEFDSAVANLSSLIEPVMIVFMGVTIGGLMLAMYSPIFNVGEVMQ